MNKNSKEKNNLQNLHFFGIGAFSILSLFELTSVFSDIIEDILVVLDTDPKVTLILAVIASLIFFTILLVLLLKIIKSRPVKNSRKLLIIAICSLLVIWVLEFCYVTYISNYLKSEYIDSFAKFSEFWKEEYLLLGILTGVPFLYYVILAIPLLKKL